jgi:hypothetical protein
MSEKKCSDVPLKENIYGNWFYCPPKLSFNVKSSYVDEVFCEVESSFHV